MSKVYLSLLLLIAHLNTTSAIDITPGFIISETDKNEVLRLIDHICADSWCSGDYNYQFTGFSCHDTSNTCTLSFKIIDRDSKPSESHSRNRRCIFKGITSISNIIHDTTLSEDFYDKLNYCVSAREADSK
jgi:hypothetical protein